MVKKSIKKAEKPKTILKNKQQQKDSVHLKKKVKVNSKLHPELKINTTELQIQTIKAGDNQNFPKKGDKVSVHYVGKLTNGNQFDSSKETGSKGFQFKIGTGQVIKGWDIGIMKLSLGQQAVLTIPPHLAYGEKGVPGTIPKNSTLIFTVELLSIA